MMGRRRILHVLLTVMLTFSIYGERILKNELPRSERDFLESPEGEPEEGGQNVTGGGDRSSLPRFLIRKIHLRTPGDRFIVKPIIGERKLRKILSAYEGRELDLVDMKELVRALEGEYARKGYITTRIYLEPDQNLQGGILRLRVLEGRIGEITVDSDGTRDRMRSFSAFTNEKGKVFNIWHIDNGIDNLNRVESNSSRMDIVPGERQGYSDIVITSERRRPFRLTLSYDDTASGRQRYRGTFEYDNLIGLNDIFTATYRGDAGKLFRKEGKREAYTEGYSFGYSFVLKGWTFSLGYDRSDENSLAAGNAGTYTLRTKGRGVDIGATKVLYRDSTEKLSLGMSLGVKDERTYIDGIHLVSQNRDITSLTLGLNGMSRLGGGIASYAMSYSRGIKLLGSKEDEPYSTGTALSPQLYPGDARYGAGKVNMNFSYYRPFYFSKVGAAIRGTFNGQYTEDALLSGEKFSIGGHGDIKGFPSSVQGDMGYMSRIEVSLIPGNDTDGFMYRIRPYVEAGLGKVRDSHDMDGRRKGRIVTLSGYALGVKYYGGKLTLDMGIAKPDKGIMKGEKARGYVSVSATF